MTFTRLAPALLALPLLAGCVIIDADEGDFSSDYSHSSAGSVFGATIQPSYVTFQVTSNGCTDRSYFEIDVDHHGGDRYSLEIDRTRPDNCRAYIAEGVEVSWSLEELGIPQGASVEIDNPVIRR